MLSTCNRTEVYAVAERFHGAYADIRDFLCELGSLRADELHPHLYSQHDDAAAQHLFEVAAGLDSAVLGESEILGQVRTAWQVGQGRGRRALDARPAVPPRPARRQAGPHRDGHRPRHGVDQPRRGRDGRPIASAPSPAATCSSSAPARWASASPPRCTRPAPARSRCATARPQRGAASPGASAGGPSASTSSATRWPTPTSSSPARRPGESVVTRDDVVANRRADAAAAARRHRRAPLRRPVGRRPRRRHAARPRRPARLGRPRPRACARRRSTASARSSPRRSSGSPSRSPPARPRRSSPSSTSGPRPCAPRELARFAGRLAELDDAEREAVEALTRAIVAKLLHGPSVRLRHDAGTPQGERNAAAVSDLFDLALSAAARSPTRSRLADPRGSPQARTQAQAVADALAAATGCDAELVLVETTGDRRQDVPLHVDRRPGRVRQGGPAGGARRPRRRRRALGQGPAVGRPRGARDRRVPAPAATPPTRWSGGRSPTCADGATVATGSVRRRAQLAAVRPDLAFVELRGNIATRLSKVPDGGAIVMAVAALQVLGDDRPRSPSASTRRVFVPPSARAASPSRRAPTTPPRSSCSAAVDDAAHAPRRRGRAQLPRRARLGLLAAGRRPRRRRRAAHVPGRRATASRSPATPSLLDARRRRTTTSPARRPRAARRGRSGE